MTAHLNSITADEFMTYVNGMVLPVSPARVDTGRVARVALYESDASVDYRDAVVLVNAPIADRFALMRLLDEIQEATMLIVRHDARVDEHSLLESGPHVLRLSRWSTWTELFTTAHRVLEDLQRYNARQHFHSLNQLAHWISEQTGAPVTIEDPEWRLLAYAVIDRPLDDVRRQTILNREVPPSRVQRLVSSGFLAAIWRSEDVVVREADGDNPARMVLALKHHDQRLGTIWLAIGDNTPQERAKEILRDVRETAVHFLLQENLRTENTARLNEAILADLITQETHSEAQTALIGAPRNTHVVAAALGPDTAHTRDLAFHLQALRAGALVTAVEARLYAAIPLKDHENSVSELSRSLETALQRVLGGASDDVIALGPRVSDISELHISARGATHVLRAHGMRWPTSTAPDRRELRVLTAEDVHESLYLPGILDLLIPASTELIKPISDLAGYDERYATDLVATVSEIIAHPGNLTEAARALGIHANSLRYRLDRVTEITGYDIRSVPNRLRFALALLLRDERRDH